MDTMSKVYLHDEATGTEVADTDPPGNGVIVDRERHYTAAEFRAVIEGGLEWVLSEAGCSLREGDVDTLKRAIKIVRGR